MGRPRKQCDCCVVCEEYKRTSQLLLQSSTSRLAVFYCTFILGFVRFLKKKKKKRKKERQKIEVRTRLQSRGSVWADEVDHEPHSQGWWV